ncbi:acylneuraminate cytidylyltransferase family protein [Aureitalea sp. L0-47]|uniref:acylneuraminate cytidylyltransferase family protein n=1 Tax=Aureitalea sp. L0-47 TaxID=2816962 RepID=UPI0022375386|nr:acylneuraminate cytidylyltransferase family protein [Aureitalea sp. L0-47]MCW5519169.1 acylneuraminate cytidylyltransferase family protein [Aureitalea sp. L0-47]
MKILGLIPARGGSKGIPGKNKKLLGGKPLLQYTAEAALGSKLLSSVIFSSEDDELRQIAIGLGLEVPFVRPEHLSTDSAGSLEVAQHALQEMEAQGKYFDALCLLQVTTPFRNSEYIDRSIKTFVESKSDSLLSVQQVPHHYNPHWVFKKGEDDKLYLSTGEKEIIKRRQDLPLSYIRDGSIYITRKDILMDRNSFYGDKVAYIESDPEIFVNIDTMTDWDRAEQIAKTL